MKLIIPAITVSVLGLGAAGGYYLARADMKPQPTEYTLSTSTEQAHAVVEASNKAPVRVAHKTKTVYPPLPEMRPEELDAYLNSISSLPFIQRLEKVTAQAKGTPYFLGPLGEGANAPYDQKPLIDFKRVDCVTFCEQSLALALSNDYPSAFQTLQKIRYKNGEIKMECRNHYTMADWTVNNRWLLTDVTPTFPGHKSMTRTISHKQLFANQNFEGIQTREPDRTLSISYIPEDKLLDVLPHVKSGDVGVLIQDLKGIFAAHTGFMFQKPNGKWIYRNATSIGPKQVTDTPFETLVASLKKSKRLIGMTFIRPRQPKAS